MKKRIFSVLISCILLFTSFSFAGCDFLGHTHNFSYTETASNKCIAHTVRNYKCEGCEETYTEIHVDSAYSMGYVCTLCGFNESEGRAEYYQKFGNSMWNMLKFDSVREFILFQDYLTTNYVTSKKHFALNYAVTDPYRHAGAQQTSFVLGDVNMMVTPNYEMCDIQYKFTTPNMVGYYHPGTQEQVNLGQAAYEETRSTKMEFPQFLSLPTTNLRGNSYTQFPYKQRQNERVVETSEELFYAFQQGYRPVAKSNSSAQEILTIAENINKNIITDGMSDFEKAYRIYAYMSQNVYYDIAGANKFTVAHNFMEWTCQTADGAFKYNTSVCDGISKAVCILFGIENIRCLRLVGDMHAWNKIYIDANPYDTDSSKKWYVIDTTHSSIQLNVSNYGAYEQNNLAQFLLTDEHKKRLGFSSYNFIDANVDAVDSINAFELLYYGEKNALGTNDFSFSNVIEFKAFLNYYKSVIEENSRQGKFTALSFYYEGVNEYNHASKLAQLKNAFSDVVNVPYSIDFDSTLTPTGEANGESLYNVVSLICFPNS